MKEESYKMIYKTRNEKKEHKKIIRIIGKNFCRNNRNKSKLIINNKKSNLLEYIKIKNNNNENIKIILNFSNKSYMFKDCESLIEFSIIDKLKYIDIDEYSQMNYSNIEINDTLWFEEGSQSFDLYSGIDDNNSSFFENNSYSIFYITTKSEEISDISKKSYIDSI